jgi:2,5-diamino-6-(ribosylamino)-4(3H)-pyrimidinone 5'-phosphate reductase
LRDTVSGYDGTMHVMKRPYVICHMAPSIDGRIVTKDWNLGPALTREYERTAGTFEADAWIIGRVSMEPYAGKARVPRRRPARKIRRVDFVAPHDAESYAIAVDPSGKLNWRSNTIDGEHVITILTESVSEGYLAWLQSIDVSYLFGGRTTISLPRVLTKLHDRFGIRKLLLEGGGKINGSFLAADVIDELSILIAPVADGGMGRPALFDAPSSAVHKLKLISAETLKAGIVWLRYRVG